MNKMLKRFKMKSIKIFGTRKLHFPCPEITEQFRSMPKRKPVNPDRNARVFFPSINAEYDLEINKIISEIKKIKAKKICLQFPDGLKINATEIAEAIQSKTKAEIVIWLGSCFGACDVPLGLEKLKFDLLVQWGHSPWIYKKK